MKTHILITAWLLISAVSFARQVAYPGKCLGEFGNYLEVNNEEVLEWKRTTKNGWKTRARIRGTIHHFYKDRNGHAHFSIQVGTADSDTIEVVFNYSFGNLPPNLKSGMLVEACGEYITSYTQTGQYPPSPDGAIIHWLHMNPKNNERPAGYLAIENKVFGQGFRQKIEKDKNYIHLFAH